MTVRSQTDDHGTRTKGRYNPFILLIILSALGGAVSVELTRIHYSTHTDPDYHSICAVNETINCVTVAQSPFSIIFNAPVSVWGILAYGVMLFFAAWGQMKSRRLHAGWPQGILSLLVFASLGASMALAYISFVYIDSVCIFCLALYSIAVLQTVVVVSELAKRKINPLRAVVVDLTTLLPRLRLWLPLAAVIGGSVIALILWFPPYWHHVGWRDLPQLPTGQDKHGHHWIGAKNPLVTVVEFSDYECPYCRSAHKYARAQAAKYPDVVRLVHRHLPLDTACNSAVKRPFHQRACEFSKAVECAGRQGAFWQMNDAIFSIQVTVPAEDVDIDQLSVRLGLDRSKLKACMADPKAMTPIKRDLMSASKRQISGTPTFFIAAQPYPGALPEVALSKAVERARAKKALSSK